MNPTGRFTDRASDYAAARPSYPAEALDAIFAEMGDAAALTVADLGAGTGISSRLLADCGARVLAVEPNAAMREAAQAHAGVTWLAATAEATEAAVDDALFSARTLGGAHGLTFYALPLDRVRRILDRVKSSLP